MPRFRILSNQIKDGTSTISGSDVKHIHNVLRLGVGDELILFDENGYEYVSSITAINNRIIESRIIRTSIINRESPLEITILQAIIKGDKMDFIVQKATELGVSSIVPVVTARSEVRNSKKIARWQKIADESIKQCGRHFSPIVHEEINFEGAIEKYRSDLNILFFEKTKDTGLKDIKINTVSPSTVSILIGPEGGFTDNESALAHDSGYIAVSLGPRILRSETASIVSVSLIQHIYGDI